MALVIGTFSAVWPAKSFNLLTTKAYAAVTNDEDYIDDLKVYNEDQNKLKLYSSNDYKTVVDGDEVEEGKTYYVKSSTNTVNIDIEGPSDKYVKIFAGSSSSAKGEDPGDDIDLSDDNIITSITIKVYGEEPAGDIRYSDNGDYTILSTYRVKVEYTGEDNADNDDIYLERLSVDNHKIELSDSQEEYTYNVNSDVSQVIVRATPEDEDYDVTIDGKRTRTSDNFKQTINLTKGKNELPIKIEDGDYEKTYTLFINRGTPAETKIPTTTNVMKASDYDNIYLEKLSIDGKIISLLKSQIYYTYNVNSDVTEVVIKGTPEDEKEEDVIIDGEYVSSSDDYKKTVRLDKGENRIPVEIEDDGDKRVYTIFVNRGSVTSTSTSSANTEIGVNNPKTNQWIQTNGVWQYKNEAGEIAKNTWVGNYYLKENGNMATGWLNYNGSWIYLGTDGAKKTGWQSIEGNWYYLDSQGKILTGWFKDVDGKYYYLNSFGAMAYNTTVDGYKLGADGVWTGR